MKIKLSTKLDAEKVSKIKSVLKESVLKTTVHGIPNIYNSEGWILKITWSVFTLTSAVICVLAIIQNIINYYKYDVSTKIRIEYDFNATFPSITVCNSIYFTTEYAAFFINSTLNNKTEYHIEKSDEFLKQKVFEFASNLTELKKLGDSLEKLVIYYSYDLDRNYKKDDFSFLFHPLFGNCYIYNSAKFDNGSNRIPKKSIKIGVSSGLFLGLNISIYKGLDKYFLSRGAIIFIHEFGSSPLKANPIYIPPKYDTNIALQRTKSTQLSKPYSDCDENTDDPDKYDSNLYKSIHQIYNKYSQKLCFDLCFHREILKACSCYVRFLTMSNEGKPCLNEVQYQCVSKFYASFINSDSFSEVCLKDCPTECDSFVFATTTSLFLKSINETQYQDEAGVSIYFEDFFVTQIDESAVMGVADLLSNIGGIAGLFLGISVLSFTEILAIIIEVVQILLIKANKENNKDIEDSEKRISI